MCAYMMLLLLVIKNVFKIEFIANKPTYSIQQKYIRQCIRYKAYVVHYAKLSSTSHK